MICTDNFTIVLFVIEDNRVVLLIACVAVEDNLSLRARWLLSVRKVTVVSVSSSGVTDSLRTIPADSHRNFLVFQSALLAGNCLTLL